METNAISKNVKKMIIKAIDNANKKYILEEFNELIDEIFDDISAKHTDVTKKEIKNEICKYAKISKNKICLNSDTETDTTYKLLKESLTCDNVNDIKQVKTNDVKQVKTNDFEQAKTIKKNCFQFKITNDDLIEHGFGYDDYQKPKSNKNVDDNPIVPYVYVLPEYKPVKKTDFKFKPFGTQWIHDKQKDDEITPQLLKITKILKKLMEIEYPEQRSPEWFAMRDKCATASDGGCIINQNSYEPQFKFLIKKVQKPPFESNINCHHGTKFESIATMIYEYRINAKVEEFGMVTHPVYGFLGASPDGIVGKYKLDGKSLTQYVGTMLEIKCPRTRKICHFGEIKGEICPIYYWVQVQLQLECCNLEKCDFWQCNLHEYGSREAFNNDTDVSEPFRSKTTGFEKGCVIQMLPFARLDDIKNGNYDDVLYGSSKYLYPPKIEMSPIDCDIWIAESLAKFDTLCPEGYYFDKVIYWKLAESNCTTIDRDKEWFAETLPTFKKMWDYVEYLRSNEDKANLLFDYIKYNPRQVGKNKKINNELNTDIMKIVETICNQPANNDKKGIKAYSAKLASFQEELDSFKK